jgi:hypothetical protein
VEKYGRGGVEPLPYHIFPLLHHPVKRDFAVYEKFGMTYIHHHTHEMHEEKLAHHVYSSSFPFSTSIQGIQCYVARLSYTISLSPVYCVERRTIETGESIFFKHSSALPCRYEGSLS